MLSFTRATITKRRQERWDRCNKRKRLERHQPVRWTKWTFVFQLSEWQMHEPVTRLLASARKCQAQDGWRLQSLGNECVSSSRQWSAMQEIEKGPEIWKSDWCKLYAVIKTLVVCELPQHTVGPADVRRFILKKNGKTSPRTHVGLKYTKTAEIFINIREQLGPSLGEIQGGQTASQSQRIENRVPNNTPCGPDDARSSLAMGQEIVQKSWNALGERRFFLQTKVRIGSGINLNRQSRRYRINLLLIPAHLCKWRARWIYHQKNLKQSKCLDFPRQWSRRMGRSTQTRRV